MANEDNGEAPPDEFHETSDSPAPVARVNARACDLSLYTVYVGVLDGFWNTKVCTFRLVQYICIQTL